MKKNVLILFLLLFLAHLTYGQGVPDRRPDKANEDFGWLAAPVPISINGIGSSLLGWGTLSNIYKEADISFAQTLYGDFDMTVLYAQDIPLFDKAYTLSTGYYSNYVAYNAYKRGIDSKADDYNVILSDQDGLFGRMTLRFWQGRIETFYQMIRFNSQVEAIYNKDGEKIPNSKGEEVKSDQYNYGVIFDITDQRFDPRKGFRFGIRHDIPYIADDTHAHYSRLDINLTGYVPLFETDTLIFNYFTSRSQVSKTGELDKNVLAQSYRCQPGVTCSEEVEQVIDDQYRSNKYGNATPLGGPNRMRAYPYSRFQAGNSLYYGIEYRMNFAEDAIPVNWYLLGGTQTSLQLALFAEYGSVSDQVSKLDDKMKASYGIGLRALISGLVYRFDLAYGDEGIAPTIFIEYPMDINPVAG